MGEDCSAEPLSPPLLSGPNSFMSLCYALWPLSNPGFFLSHTPHQGHHGGHDSIYFCLALDAFIF